MVFVDKQRNLQIAHRPGGQIVSDAFDTGEIQLVIEHFEVEDRAVQRFAVADAPQIALHLFGVVALMAAHRFQLAADAGGGLIQRGLRLEMHLHRQHVDHRPGGAQGGRSGTAHEDKTGAETRLAAQARYPQRHQRHRHIGGVQLLRAHCTSSAKACGSQRCSNRWMRGVGVCPASGCGQSVAGGGNCRAFSSQKSASRCQAGASR